MEQFRPRYQPRILEWCRRWRLQESDAQDVSQAVLLKLSRSMATFVYDPSRSFRGWLKTITHHAWRDLVDERKRTGVGSGDSRMGELLENIEAGDSLVEQLEEEYRRELVDEAMARVRPRVAPRTWDAFRLTALEGCSGAAAAAQLQMKVAHVFVAKSEVKDDDPEGDPETGRDRMIHCPDREQLELLLANAPGRHRAR